jgi:glutaredoxin
MGNLEMKKIFILALMAIIILMPLTGAVNVTKSSNDNANLEVENLSKGEFTHTVFVEYGSTTGCPYCVTASSQLYSIYNSGDLDFHYVSLVYDVGNFRVRNRMTDLGIRSVPDVFFDGKYKHLIGAQKDEEPYRTRINQSGEREVPNIDLDVDVIWKGGGTLKITVTYVNNEPDKYDGHLRVYVVEKESRWNDNGGNPYHYAALDIPIDHDLNNLARSRPRPLGGTRTFEKTWYGALHNFSDITKENIEVIAAVFDKDTDHAVESASATPVSSDSSNHLFSLALYPAIQSFLEKLSNTFPILERLFGL